VTTTQTTTQELARLAELLATTTGADHDAIAAEATKVARKSWIRRHTPTVTPRPWLASVTGSPLAEAMAR
jgi:hypothetical protein